LVFRRDLVRPSFRPDRPGPSAESSICYNHTLATKARAGSLTSAEQAEVEAHSRVRSLLGILKSKARRALKRRTSNQDTSGLFKLDNCLVTKRLTCGKIMVR
jgi:hypothetical protein